MNAKDTVKKGYDCFSKGDMETFFNEVIHDDCVWTHPGVPGKHPLSGVHNGKQAMMGRVFKNSSNVGKLSSNTY